MITWGLRIPINFAFKYLNNVKIVGQGWRLTTLVFFIFRTIY